MHHRKEFISGFWKKPCIAKHSCWWVGQELRAACEMGISHTSDICLCKRGVEDTSHFLLFFPFYITQRETLNARVNEILRRNNLDFIANTELYLYGHSSLKNLDNQKILAATIEYIKNTNRFST